MLTASTWTESKDLFLRYRDLNILSGYIEILATGASHNSKVLGLKTNGTLYVHYLEHWSTIDDKFHNFVVQLLLELT